MSPEEMAARVRRRVERTSSGDLIAWAELAVCGMQRQLDDFRRDPCEDHLAEIKLAALSMDAVADELAVRLKQSQDTS